MKTKGYSIGEMSKETGVNIETIRYYERIDLMPHPDRTEGGNRQFNHDQLKRLAFIKRSRELGFSIEETRGLLGMTDKSDFTCSQVHKLTMSHLAAIKTKLVDLRRMEKVLKQMAAECRRGDVPDCPIIDELFQFVSEKQTSGEHPHLPMS